MMRRMTLVLATATAAALYGADAMAQQSTAPVRQPRRLAPGVETVVVPQILVQEQRENPRIFALEFAYKAPRFITVIEPDDGGQLKRKRVWYLAYRITNRTGQSRMFVPELTLISTDTGKSYRDQVLPTVHKAIAQREDPALDWKNSATIVGEIPPTPEKGFDLSTYGIATWEGVDSETDYFSVVVTGLSNGYKIAQGAGDEARRVLDKTLKLNFWRPGDAQFENEREIRPISQAPASVIGEGKKAPPDHEWIYR